MMCLHIKMGNEIHSMSFSFGDKARRLHDFGKISVQLFALILRLHNGLQYMRGNGRFTSLFIFSLIKHIKMIEIFTGICTKQRFFLESVDYDV